MTLNASPVLDGITASRITTSRLETRVLFSGSRNDTPVMFLHGNLSSATWWEETMLSLPQGYRGIAPDQRGFGDASIEAKIDATRGVGDLVDDVVALLDELDIGTAHIVGNSFGGSVVWQLLMEHPQRFITATQVAPGSPYGFGGTKGVHGVPCSPDCSGSGAGLVSKKLCSFIAQGDRSVVSPFSPRSALRNLVFKPPFIPKREEDLLSSMLSIHLGEKDFPGDYLVSQHWPFAAPGVWGAANALSPKYAADVTRLYGIVPKVPILWIRGSHDASVSDTAASDAGRLGQLGLMPGWPGAAMFPPQPMLAQTRAVLSEYKANGGEVKEIVIDGTGHVPFIDKPDEFNRHFHSHITSSRLR